MGILLILVFLLIGIIIGNYGGSAFGSIKFFLKWLVAKIIYDFAQFIVYRIVDRYTAYFSFLFNQG